MTKREQKEQDRKAKMLPLALERVKRWNEFAGKVSRSFWTSDFKEVTYKNPEYQLVTEYKQLLKTQRPKQDLLAWVQANVPL